ncbi:aldolase/citrate lyase family protein [Telmatospirillum sp.]|uniref:aldolase/citrate lyase family protein n=1 Tax=Telmatospirillum sp. TaxID=2079197 RepID=UPI00285134B8|nr:aldolase/citrate lyase family protein [Telmatospirillum sp.]MDR3439726.1 aldolase/citrate lyase family protein [Telmatospirillum sp.]
MNSTLPVNTFKRAIKSGHLQIGLWSILSNHMTVEIIAGAGFDWLVLDTEHAPNELPMVMMQLQAATGGTAHPVVRIPWNDTVDIKRYLDIGVQTLLIPSIESADEARAAVAATRYPPKGVRGYSAAPRAALYGRVKGYPQICEEEICVLLQIETRKGMEHLEEIAAVEGVDGLFVGPGDLSAALGHVGDPKHPDMLAAIDDTLARIRAAGKPAGMLTPDEKLAQHYIDTGCLFVAVGSDLGLLARGSEQLAARFKA